MFKFKSETNKKLQLIQVTVYLHKQIIAKGSIPYTPFLNPKAAARGWALMQARLYLKNQRAEDQGTVLDYGTINKIR